MKLSYKFFLVRLKTFTRKRTTSSLLERDDFFKESYKRISTISYCGDELMGVLNRHLRTIQEQSYVLDKPLRMKDYSSFELDKEYFYLLERFYSRRDFSDYIGLKSQGILRFFLIHLDIYLEKCFYAEQRSKALYFHIAKLCYNLFILASNKLAMWGSIDDKIINYIQCITQENFCEFIKKLRAYKLREKISTGTDDELVEAFNEIQSMDFNIVFSEDWWSLDDILPEDFLINWEREIDDFENCLVEPEDIRDDALEIYRSACKNAIFRLKKEDIKPPHITEILSNISESKIFLDNKFMESKNTGSVRTDYRKNINEILKFSFLNKSPNIYKRTVIYVSPANERDAWIPNLDTRLRNTYYDRLFYHIFHNHPSFMMVDELEFDKKMSNLYKHDGFFIMVDIKKEGLTLPHPLIKILCEELDKVYNFNFTYMYKCIEQQKVLKDGYFHRTKRGRGLGMLNHMMSAIHSIITDILPYEGKIFTDDVVYKLHPQINNLESSKVCLRNIVRFYNRLGIPISSKKSIISKSFVFLEEYFNTEFYGVESDKYIRALFSVLNAIFCDSFAEFKKRIYNYSLSINLDKVFWQGIKKLFSQLNSEFNAEPFMRDWELEMPPYLGGFGLCNIESELDCELINISTYSQDVLFNISRILQRQKEINTDEIIHEHKKVTLDKDLVYEEYFTLNDQSNEFDKELFRFLDRDILIKQLEDKLNIVSKRNNRNSLRIRKRILNINKNRRDILDYFEVTDFKGRSDLIEDIIRYNESEGIKNFAIPEYFVTYQVPYHRDSKEGRAVKDFPQLYSKEERVLSYLYNKGVLDLRPPIAFITHLHEYHRNFELEKSFSFENKSFFEDDFVKENMDILPYVLFFNVNVEFALMEYCMRTTFIPKTFLNGYDQTEWDEYKDKFIFVYLENSDFDLTGTRKSVSEETYRIWKMVPSHMPPLDRAFYFDMVLHSNILKNNSGSLVNLVNLLTENYQNKALDTKLYDEETSTLIDEVFEFEYLINIQTELQEEFTDFLYLEEETVYTLNPAYNPGETVSETESEEERRLIELHNYNPSLDGEGFDYSDLIDEADFSDNESEVDPFSYFD